MLSGTPLLMRCNLNITANLTQYWNQIRYMFFKADIFMIEKCRDQRVVIVSHVRLLRIQSNDTMESELKQLN